MPINIVIVIKRVNSKVKFTPDPAIIQAGDSVNWLNQDDAGDHAGAHQLAPVGGSATAWMPFSFLPGVGGQSPIVGFPAKGTFPYQCVVAGHQGETGTIQVN